MSESKPDKSNRPSYRPLIGIAIVSMLVCGLFFPLLITAIAQVAMPNQANGELVQVGGRTVGSALIDNNFTLSIFFHARNDSASGVDPDITVQDAYSQIPRIHLATGIPSDSIQKIVDANTEGTWWVFGSGYVNVLKVNLALIDSNPTVYGNYTH
jgi:potassium-transporting ATPase KdpC subunit